MRIMSKKLAWTGRALSWLTGLFVLTSGLNVLFFRSDDLREGFAKFGYPENVMPTIGVCAFGAALLYLIPRTSILGAILLTGYLGGAVATHVRVNDPAFIAPLVVGMLVWLGLFLRQEPIRSLLPLQR